MNFALGNNYDFSNLGEDYGFKSGYQRLTAIPNPSKSWVFVDEHPDSILTGLFTVRMKQHSWEHLPASYHNGACGFTFADGHSEIKKWLDPGLTPLRYNLCDLTTITLGRTPHLPHWATGIISGCKRNARATMTESNLNCA